VGNKEERESGMAVEREMERRQERKIRRREGEGRVTIKIDVVKGDGY